MLIEQKSKHNYAVSMLEISPTNLVMLLSTGASHTQNLSKQILVQRKEDQIARLKFVAISIFSQSN